MRADDIGNDTSLVHKLRSNAALARRRNIKYIEQFQTRFFRSQENPEDNAQESHETVQIARSPTLLPSIFCEPLTSTGSSLREKDK